ncbi:MAG TPA: putative 2OG-Fe(II) oxygenase [Gammaproteobacteria bacterium]|nr:putative 2OG-Fe(II) oxygenase [Gammaproteobacteria bacterium]
MSMTFHDTIETHFPTRVMQRRHESVADLNTALFQVIDGLRQRYADSAENAVNTGQVSTQGGYQTSTRMNFLQRTEPAVTAFRDQVLMPAVKSYFEEVFGDAAVRLKYWTMGWSNMLREGDWQGPHMHPTPYNLASGVYYVKLPPDKPPPQGCIEFISPHPISAHHGDVTTRRIVPHEGELLLFPPYYMHYVHPFKGPGERAIISFDVIKHPLDVTFTF